MRNVFRLSVLLAGVAVLSVLSLRAQDPPKEPEPETTTPTTSRKRPSFFHRPAEKSAPRQLEYAKGLMERGKLRKASKQLNALVHAWPESPEAVVAQQTYAELLEKRGYPRDAFDEYQYLVEHYAGQFPYGAVLDRQFRLANQVMMARRAKFLFLPGYTVPEDALPLFEKVVRNAPDWSQAPQAQFMVGVINQDARNYDEAVDAYGALLNRYPHSPFAEEASFRRAESLYKGVLHDNPRDEQSCRSALSAMAAFLRDYPGSANEATAQKCLDELKDRLADMYYERAEFYDRIARKPKSAILAYEDFLRVCPSSGRASEVSERLEALKAKVEKTDEK
jgi:outer membrane assembly lipoprotein YfiO